MTPNRPSTASWSMSSVAYGAVNPGETTRPTPPSSDFSIAGGAVGPGRGTGRHRIYIAGPLSNGDRTANRWAAIEAGLALIEARFSPLVPHLWDFVLQADDIPRNEWLAVDLPWVLAAEAVLRLPGASVGADIETAWATQHGVPVFHSVEQVVTHFRGH